MSEIYYYLQQAFSENDKTTLFKITKNCVFIHTNSMSDQQFKVIYNFMQKHNFVIDIEVNVFHEMMITLEKVKDNE